ncbi:MAG UNVERIFIED_CONTAM: hypothetical protein LVR29_03540 [Microcystis novacekii LVE1205-3]
MKALEVKEKREIVLLKEKRELEAKIAADNAQDGTRAEIQKLELQISKLSEQERILSSQYQKELKNPFNYYCLLSFKGGGDGKTVRVIEHVESWPYIMGLELVEQEISDWQKVKFISTGDGYYVMSFKGGGDGKTVRVIGRGSGRLILWV